MSPKYDDLDVRKNMIKSLGLDELPEIIPESIDALSGVIENGTLLLKEYDFEALLEGARAR